MNMLPCVAKGFIEVIKNLEMGSYPRSSSELSVIIRVLIKGGRRAADRGTGNRDLRCGTAGCRMG